MCNVSLYGLYYVLMCEYYVMKRKTGAKSAVFAPVSLN